MGDVSDWLPALVTVGAISCGLGVLLFNALDRTWTNLSGVVFYIAAGLAVATVLPFVNEVDASDPGWLARLQGQFEVAVIAASAVYVKGILATAQVSARAGKVVGWAIRAGFALAAWHAVASFVFPAQRLNDFEMKGLTASAYERSGFWLFALFWIVTGLVFGTAFVILARQRLDSAERTRALYSALASPPLLTFPMLPPQISVVAGTVALLLILNGQMRYLAVHSRRGVFLSRFLSDQVTHQVRSDGLNEVMRPHEVELTVVACDLRGFTSYAEAVPSQSVIDLLGEYYEAVGIAVAEHDGTIKDYAGDGVLILVGAPLAREDHAAAGLALAHRLLAVIAPVLDHWSTGPHPLGIGVGIASGRVTVGAIGSSSRMEYTAVGTAVNLASRLCSSATDGEILAAQRTVELAQVDEVEPRGSVQVKGLSAEQEIYAVLT
jgi:class 3 adenylate cyclase